MNNRSRPHKIQHLLAATALIASFAVITSSAWSQDSEDSEEQQSKPKATRPAPRQSELSKMRLLAKSLPKGQAKWLKVADKYFLAAYIPARNANPKGWVLMLPDAGQLPTWPGSLSSLEQFLPSKGWHVLSLSLPEPFIPEPPERPMEASPPAEGNAEEGTTEMEMPEPEVGPNEKNEIFDDATNTIGDGSFIPEEEQDAKEPDKSDQEQLAQDRIIAALEFISSQSNAGRQLVMYGHGAGATRAATYFSEVGSPDTLKAVILLNAHNSIPHQPSSMSGLLGSPNLPILDIVTDQSQAQQREASKRQQLASQNGLRYYEQRNIIAPPHDNTNRVIWGFLSRQR